MSTMISICGLNCSACDAYKLTQANDRQGLEKLAAQWREAFHSDDITADNILCDGCLAEGRKAGYCAMCQIRACGLSRNLPNCAHCADYETCPTLADFLNQDPNGTARKGLEAVRASLA